MVLSPANVRQIRPFRYPGGKTWLVPGMAAILQSLPQRPVLFLNAFAGGASIGLAAADQGLAGRVLLVERDPDVAAAAPAGDLRRLQDRIARFTLNLPAVQDVISSEPASDFERAFRTVLRNRVQRGGILAKNAGLLKAGKKGRGIASRRYPETLVQRLSHVRALADAGRLSVAEGCGLDAIEQHARPDVFVFADPPYIAGGKHAGRRLYRLPALDHDCPLDLLAAHPRAGGGDLRRQRRHSEESRGARPRLPVRTHAIDPSRRSHRTPADPTSSDLTGRACTLDGPPLSDWRSTVRLETRPAWIRLGQQLLAHAGPGGGWHLAHSGRQPIRNGAPRPLRAERPGDDADDRIPAPGETPPLLPEPDIADRARSPQPLPVRVLLAWPGVLVGLPGLAKDRWFAEGPLVPLGDGPGTPEPAPGLWDLLRAEAAVLALPDQGWAWLLPAATAHARLAQAEAHGQAAADWRHQDRGRVALRLQRLGPLLCLTEVGGGSDFLLGAFPA